MKIGNVTIENNVFLAPMAGVTDLTFRRICRRWGAGMTYTEMVSAKGLYYKDKKTSSLLARDEDEVPSAVQIFGSEPDIIAAAVPDALRFGADILDINMGCPAPKIVNNGDGSALLKNPALAGKIVDAAARAAKNVPVTVKFRSGFSPDSINAVEMAKIFEANGAAAICLHPRTRDMYYSGKADRSLVTAVKRAVKIPVIASGDLFSAANIADTFAETGCDAVMVARGAEGNPFIFRQARELLTGGKVEFFPTVRDRLGAALLHLRTICAEKGEERGIKEARKHMAWYIKGVANAGILRQKLFCAGSLAEAEALISEFSEGN